MKTQASRAEVAASHRPHERRPERLHLRNGARADLATRVLASVVLAALLALGLPYVQVPFTVLKISLLVATELGLLSLLLGLFLRAQTSFAGLQLVIASLSMLVLRSHGYPYVALAAGTLVLAAGLASLLVWRNDAAFPDAEWLLQRFSAPRRRARVKPAGEGH